MTSEAPRRTRRAARLLVEAADGAVLLFRFTPPDRPPFWATPGGECDPGESYPNAARRELEEETGLVLDPGDVITERTNDFITFDGEPVTAREAWFHIRVADRAIDTGGHTEVELMVMQSHRWFTREELSDWRETIFPEDIVQMLARIDPA